MPLAYSDCMVTAATNYGLKESLICDRDRGQC
jgi:hypothetical protein